MYTPSTSRNSCSIDKETTSIVVVVEKIPMDNDWNNWLYVMNPDAAASCQLLTFKDMEGRKFNCTVFERL